MPQKKKKKKKTPCFTGARNFQVGSVSRNIFSFWWTPLKTQKSQKNFKKKFWKYSQLFSKFFSQFSSTLAKNNWYYMILAN